MNTSPDTTARERAPFASVVHFKPHCLFQGKFKSYSFRSDDVSPANTPTAKQYAYLENFVLSGLRGEFWDAALFTNVGGLRFPPQLQHLQVSSRNLVWKHNHVKFTRDNRQYLDLSFLEHSFEPAALEWLAGSFEQMQAPAVDPLTEALRTYKSTLNL